jgi:hypothetical protein
MGCNDISNEPPTGAVLDIPSDQATLHRERRCQGLRLYQRCGKPLLIGVTSQTEITMLATVTTI